VRYFLQEFSADYGQKPKTIDDEALALFVRYAWPGNVRELRNIIERLIIMVPGPVLTAGSVPIHISSLQQRPPVPVLSDSGKESRGHATLKDARAAFEREFITEKLKEFRGNISRTADAIGVERSNLHRKIKALDIETGD